MFLFGLLVEQYSLINIFCHNFNKNDFTFCVFPNKLQKSRISAAESFNVFIFNHFLLNWLLFPQQVKPRGQMDRQKQQQEVLLF